MRNRFSAARWAYWIHGLAGLKLGLVMSVIVVSGTLAVFGHEWDWLFGPYQRVQPEGEPAGLAAVHAAAKRAYPDHALLELKAPRGPRSAASLIAVAPNGQYRRLYVDPYRPSRVADTGLLSAQVFLRQLHQSLLLPKYGRYFVSALAALTLLSLVSGLICYKRFWRGFLRLPRRRDLRTFLGDSHRLAAVWSIWFLALMAVTGLWYFYESVDTFGDHLGTPDLPAAAVPSDGSARPARVPLAAAIERAREAVPGLDVRRVDLPQRAQEPVVVQGRSGAWLVRPRATSVAINPYAGAVHAVQRASELSVKARLHEAADPLHFGTFAGFASKLVWFVFGLAMSFLTISGMVIHAKRLRRPTRARRRTRNAAVSEAA
jgi:uncharacterized iron-regulated membrane protein